jgi:hypothetical protein
MRPYEYAQKGWCRGAFARNSRGVAVSAHSPDATSWCLLGACYAAGEPGMALWLRGASIWNNVSIWNDHTPGRTREEVVMALALADGFYAVARARAR